jgi:ATP-dependent DNA ligase
MEKTASLSMRPSLPDSPQFSHSLSKPGLFFNEHIEGDGPTVFAHACKLGLEGIISKRKDSAYRSGRSPDWLKMKNSDAPAVKHEEEEDWAKKKGR